MTPHSPTPWKVGADKDSVRNREDYVLARCMGGKHDPGEYARAEADAIHIVRCVNAHEALVAALLGFLTCHNIGATERTLQHVRHSAKEALKLAGVSDV